MTVPRALAVFCFSLAVFIPIINGFRLGSVNGGSNCASCTIVLGVIDHLSILYNESIVESLERYCNYFTDQFRTYCKEAVDFLGRNIGRRSF